MKAKKPLLEISSAAASQLDKLSKEKGGAAMRLGVTTKGCSGLAYNLEYLEAGAEAPKFDEKIECGGVELYVDPQAVMFLFNSRMDYSEEGLVNGFTFENPNATGSCGCGESFSVSPELLSEALRQKRGEQKST